MMILSKIVEIVSCGWVIYKRTSSAYNDILFSDFSVFVTMNVWILLARSSIARAKIIHTLMFGIQYLAQSHLDMQTRGVKPAAFQ